MESKLTGTAALVTGASSGIGAATARRPAAVWAALCMRVGEEGLLLAQATFADGLGCVWRHR